MRVSRSHREAPATAPGFSFSETILRPKRKLLGLFARPAPAVGLPLSVQIAEVIRSAPGKRGLPAAGAEDRGIWREQQVVRQGYRCTEQLQSSLRPAFGKCGCF